MPAGRRHRSSFSVCECQQFFCGVRHIFSLDLLPVIFDKLDKYGTSDGRYTHGKQSRRSLGSIQSVEEAVEAQVLRPSTSSARDTNSRSKSCVVRVKTNNQQPLARDSTGCSTCHIPSPHRSNTPTPQHSCDTATLQRCNGTSHCHVGSAMTRWRPIHPSINKQQTRTNTRALQQKAKSKIVKL